MRSSYLATAVCLSILTASLAACDSAPGPDAGSSRPPVLSAFTYSPRLVNLAQAPDDWIEGDSVRVPLEISVQARAGDEAIEEIVYVVQSPTLGAPPLASGSLSLAGASHYAATASVLIPGAEVGLYTILVFGVDTRGQVSNEMRGLLRFEAAGSPPVIESVEAPATVTRPAAGEPAVLLEIVAVVSDEDGLANIARVQFWNVDRPEARIAMADDGENGDAVAGDGRYTAIVQVASSNEPGTNTLAFQASDRSGLTSDVVEKQITIE